MVKKIKKCSCALFSDPRYQGRYVALDPVEGKKIIAHDRDAGVLMDKARRMGVVAPAIVFVPGNDFTCIY